MLRSCLPVELCDVDDVLLLEEIASEVTGRQPASQRLAHNHQHHQQQHQQRQEQVNVRLVSVKGVFRNRWLGTQQFSLEGVRLVAALVSNENDQQLITASHVSEPLTWQPKLTLQPDGLAFQATWKNTCSSGGDDDKEGGANVLSFDHTTATSSSSGYQLVLALVHHAKEKETTNDDFLLACPCGETTLVMNSYSARRRNGGRRELSVLGKPSPRNFVLFPCFQGAKGSSSSSPPPSSSSSSSPYNNNKMEEKKTKSYRGDDIELPYLSLEKASLTIDVSWKEKEDHVEVCYAGQNAVRFKYPAGMKMMGQEQLVMEEAPTGYALHRFPKDHHHNNNHDDAHYNGPTPAAGSTDENDRDDESLLSLRVREELNSMAQRQQFLSPSKIMYDQADKMAHSINDNKVHGGSELLDDVMRALDVEFEAATQTSPAALPTPQTAHDNNPTKTQRSNSEIAPSPSLVLPKEPTPMTRPVSDGTLFTPKPKRNWSNAFRKGHSLNKQQSSTTMRKLDETVLKELAVTLDDQNGVQRKVQPHNEKDHEQTTKAAANFCPPRKEKRSPPRKGLFSGFRSKSRDKRQEGSSSSSSASSLDTSNHSESTGTDAFTDLNNNNHVDHVAGQSESQDLALVVNVSESGDEDTVGAIRLLDSFCSNGDEVIQEVDNFFPPVAQAPQREASNVTKDSKDTRVTWVSHESAESTSWERKSSFATIAGSFLGSHALCASLSDVTTDNSLEQKRSVEKHKPLQRYRSMESFLSAKSTNSDEITTLSKIEDRMIMNAYHACGGRHIDAVTDTILRHTPNLIQRWLDRSDSETTPAITSESRIEAIRSQSADDSLFSLADLDFERATTTASQALSRQLTTITEESETRGLHAPTTSSSGTDAPSIKANNDDVNANVGHATLMNSVDPMVALRSMASF